MYLNSSKHLVPLAPLQTLVEIQVDTRERHRTNVNLNNIKLNYSTSHKSQAPHPLISTDPPLLRGVPVRLVQSQLLPKICCAQP